MASPKYFGLLFLIGLLSFLTQFADCVKVTLLDTTKLERLNWKTFSQSNTSYSGWIEGSYDFEDDNIARIYTVCNIQKSNVHNWLRTPFIHIGDAKRLSVEMKFTMRECKEYPEPEHLQSCKESYKLLYHESEYDTANDHMPSWDTYVYKHIDVIAADHTFSDLLEPIINTETRQITINRRGVYFAFYDTGACVTLLSIKIYYILCEKVIANFAIFPNTTTSIDKGDVKQADGVCVDHAAIEMPPRNLCKASGKWDFLTGGCKCMPGYQPGPQGNSCDDCPQGSYKWNTGNHVCNKCPTNSESVKMGAVECTCSKGYYRKPDDDRAMPCTKPPTNLRNLKVQYKDQTTVNLTWMHPKDLGGRRDLVYTVDCVSCGSVTFTPRRTGFNSTGVSVTGLSPTTTYKIIIYAENGVSTQSGIKNGEHIYFKTDNPLPAKVSNSHFVSIGPTYVSLAWEQPSDSKMRFDLYEVRYHIDDKKVGNVTLKRTINQNVTITSLAYETKYQFQVRGHTSNAGGRASNGGWGEYSRGMFATTGHGGIRVNPQPADNPVGIIIGSAIAVVVCMLIVIIMVIIFLRRNHRACNEKNASDCDTLQYSNVTVPLFTPPGQAKTYIDPHTYEDPNQAVKEFAKEIDVSLITIETVIGGGEFGDVCKGRLRVPCRGDVTVAIKTLKAGASDKNRYDFLTEASIMGQFEDPNVIYLEGVVTKSNPIMIVTEYMENGSLDTFLRNNDGKFTILQLIGMMRGIASGMRYLADMGYVHRDLAARNILVNETLVCKVADFGLSREIESDDTEGAYTTKGGKIPVRWTAPEAIAYRKFTSASDVWSYGVVMWEVMAYGERPYWSWSNQDVIKAVDKGYRLPPPMECPEALYQMMCECWMKERSSRPKFPGIVKHLDKLIRSPEDLRKVAQAKPHQYLNPNSFDISMFESVEEWLTSLKMERYIDHFLQAGYTSMQTVALLTLKDLINIGVTLVGHQKKIMNSVQTMRAQLSGAAVQVSEGFLV